MKAKIGARVVASLKPASQPFEVWDTDLNGFLLRVRPSGVMTYLFSYRRPDGRRTNYSLGRYPGLSPTQARDLALAIAAGVKQGRDPVYEKRRARVGTLKSFIKEKYGPWVLSHKKSGQETLDRIESCFDDFLDKPLTEISQWVVESWRKKKRDSGAQSATINRDLNCLKAALSKAVEWNVIDLHPLQKLKPLKTDDTGIVRYLSESEELRLREALNQRETSIRNARERANRWRLDRDYSEKPNLNGRSFVDYLQPMVLMSLNTGLRQGEHLGLRWEDWNQAGRSIKVSGRTTKSEKTRYLPLNAEATAVLTAWWNSLGRPCSGIIFANRDGSQLTQVKTAWRNLLSTAQIENFRWHDCRHHFASRLVQSGVDLNTVRELLGHSSLKMVLRYAHLSPSATAAAVAKLDAPRLLDQRQEVIRGFSN